MRLRVHQPHCLLEPYGPKKRHWFAGRQRVANEPGHRMRSRNPLRAGGGRVGWALSIVLCLAWSGVSCSPASAGGEAGGGTAQGASESQAKSAVTIHAAAVHISFDREPEKLPFDPKSQRLRAAGAQAAALLGHPLRLRFAVALLPQYRDSFEQQLIDVFEQAAQDLTLAKKRDPELLDWTRRYLEEIAFHYDAGATRSNATFQTRTGRIDVHTSAEYYRLLEQGQIFAALSSSYDENLEERYGQAAPSKLPPNERLAYAQFLTGHRPFGPKRADLAKKASYQTDPRAITLLRLLELSKIVGAGNDEPHLRELLDRELLREGNYFHAAYVHHPGLATTAPAEGTFARAEKQWGRWLSSRFSHLPPKEKKVALETLYVRNFNTNVDRYGRYQDRAFSGLDRFALAWTVVEDWIEHGHPIETPDDREQGLLFEHVVCPHPADATGHRGRGPRCDYDLWDDAMTRPEGAKRLFATISSTGDRLLTESSVINVVHGGGQEGLISFLRAIEENDHVWTWAFTTAADEYQSSLPAEFVDEARRLYRHYPRRRGHVLYLLSQLDLYDHGRVPFATWQRSFDALVDGASFAIYLQHGTRAITQLPLVWPALGPGYSRAEPLVEQLDRLTMAKKDWPYQALRKMVSLLCKSGGKSDLDLLHRYFKKEAQAHPSRWKSLDGLVHDTTPGSRCR